MVKNSPVNAGDIRDSGSVLGLRRPPEECLANLSSILAWRILLTQEPDGLQYIRSQKFGHHRGSPGSSDSKASVYNAGDLGLIPGLGRSPGKGHGNSLQYSCLENPMDRGVWWATICGVTKNRTRLSDFTNVLSHFLTNGHVHIHCSQRKKELCSRLPLDLSCNINSSLGLQPANLPCRFWI